MGLAALSIDLGLARLMQGQMQSAANSAALEGLRWRDQLPPDQTTGSSPTASDLDIARRTEAAEMVSQVFADDQDNGITFGAGQVVQASGGFGDPALAASERLQVTELSASSRLYQLQSNTVNSQYGDMVSGQYSSATGAPVGEGADYSRTDFAPAQADDGPTSSGYPAGNGSFLVRMRRTVSTNFPQGPSGNDDEPGVSSSGPTIPFLFGRGAAITQSPGATYNPRQDGIALRATAIADARPAMTVGYAYVGQNSAVLNGLLPFGVSTVAPSFPLTATPPASTGGNWTVTDASGNNLFPPTGSVLATVAQSVLSVGNTLPTSSALSLNIAGWPGPSSVTPWYLPVYVTYTPQGQDAVQLAVVYGFLAVQLSGASWSGSITVSAYSQASGGASSTISSRNAMAWPASADSYERAYADILPYAVGLNQGLSSATVSLLLAPALVGGDTLPPLTSFSP